MTIFISGQSQVIQLLSAISAPKTLDGEVKLVSLRDADRLRFAHIALGPAVDDARMC